MGKRVGRHGLARDSRAAAVAIVLLLSGCDGGLGLGAATDGAPAEAQPAVSLPGPTDIAAPEVFQVSEPGLWDGRPSLGGVWVAHPDVQDPERVRIVNRETGAEIIGALFRRERDLPGPALQVSSDAAEALGMLPGAPAQLEVTALRRQEAPPPAPAAATPAPTPTSDAPATGAAPEAGAVTAQPTTPPAAAPAARAPSDQAAVQAVMDALAVIFSAGPEPELPDQPSDAPAPTAQAADGIATTTLAPADTQTASDPSLRSPYVQLGTYEVEAFANDTAQGLAAKGLPVQVVPVEGGGWRLLLGPAQSEEEQQALQARAVAEGFADAYLVRG